MTNERRHVIGLVANRALRQGPASPLIRLIRVLEPYFRDVLQPEIHAVEGTYRALLRNGLLRDYPHLHPLPSGRQGGLVALADRVVLGAGDGGQPLDTVIYITDPRDATSMFPDSLALKRECVVTGTTFLATYQAATEWYALDWCARTLAAGDPHPSALAHLLSPDLVNRMMPEAGLEAQTLALIAHDTRKGAILEFAEAHFDLLSRFAARLATGTTGTLLNGERPARLAEAWEEVEAEAQAFERLGHVPARLRSARTANAETEAARKRLAERHAGQRWVEPQPSGPKGGDVRIAEAVLRKACHKVIFFEDPHVAREHEADIQLLERTTRIPEQDVFLLHDEASARRWAEAWGRCLEGGRTTAPVTLTDAFRRLWGVDLVLAEPEDAANTRGIEGPPNGLSRPVLERGAMYLHALAADRVEQGPASGAPARVAITWGYEAHRLAETLSDLPGWLAKASAGAGLSRAIAPPGFVRPTQVCAAPLVGMMGATDPRCEANHSAALLAKHFGGEARTLPHYAFRDAAVAAEPAGPARAPENAGFWDALDALAVTCDPVDSCLGPGATLPAALHEQIEGRAVAEVAGIFLRADGGELALRGFDRVGIGAAQLRSAAARGGSVLLCGGGAERVRPALAALRAGFASVLVTDLDFAWEILNTAAAEVEESA